MQFHGVSQKVFHGNSWDILGFDDIGVSFLDNQKITVESHDVIKFTSRTAPNQA